MDKLEEEFCLMKEFYMPAKRLKVRRSMTIQKSEMLRSLIMYRVEFSESAVKALKIQIGIQQVIIKNWAVKNLADCDSPRIHGKAQGNLSEYMAIQSR